jgi:hypothetical protein
MKQVSFKKNEQDLIQYMKENGYYNNFSYYVKDLIRKDMKENKSFNIPTTKNKRNTNFGMD